MNSSDFLSFVLGCIIKCKLGNSLWFLLGNNLNHFYNSWYTLWKKNNTPNKTLIGEYTSAESVFNFVQPYYALMPGCKKNIESHTSCSRLVYSPSVCSLMIIISTLLCLTHRKRNKIYKRPQEINNNIIKTIATRNVFLTGFGEGSYLSDKWVLLTSFDS